MYACPCTASSDAASRVGAGEERTWGGDACIALVGVACSHHGRCKHPRPAPHHPRPYASQVAPNVILLKTYPCKATLVVARCGLPDCSPPAAAPPGLEWVRAVPPQAAQPAPTPDSSRTAGGSEESSRGETCIGTKEVSGREPFGCQTSHL